MMQPIQFSGLIQPLAPLSPALAPAKAPDVQPGGFREMLLDNLNEVNRLQDEADRQVKALVTGETDDVGSVLVAVNKAGVAFDLLMEVRNKLMDAYQEIQQMRV